MEGGDLTMKMSVYLKNTSKKKTSKERFLGQFMKNETPVQIATETVVIEKKGSFQVPTFEIT